MEGEPFNEHKARNLLRGIVHAGHVGFTPHARQEMAHDHLTAQDALNVLCAGRIPEAAEERLGTWRYRVRTPRMVFVVAFRSAMECTVVTGWRLMP